MEEERQGTILLIVLTVSSELALREAVNAKSIQVRLESYLSSHGSSLRPSSDLIHTIRTTL